MHALRELDAYFRDLLNRDEYAGVSAMLRHYPGDDVTVVLLSNMEDGVWDPVWEMHEIVAPGHSRG
jgi:hypothetical protein